MNAYHSPRDLIIDSEIHVSYAILFELAFHIVVLIKLQALIPLGIGRYTNPRLLYFDPARDINPLALIIEFGIHVCMREKRLLAAALNNFPGLGRILQNMQVFLKTRER